MHGQALAIAAEHEQLAKDQANPTKSDEQALNCAVLLKLGKNVDGQRRHYVSIRQVVKLSPSIRSALAATPTSQRTLLKRMQLVDLDIVRKVESVKPGLQSQSQAAATRHSGLHEAIAICLVEEEPLAGHEMHVYCSQKADCLDKQHGMHQQWRITE